MFRVVSGIVLVYFLIVFGLQYNDPDPLLWMLIYGYASIVTAMAVQKTYTAWSAVGALGSLAGFCFLIPYYDPAVPWIEVEEVREALGLLIVALWLCALTVAWIRTRKTAPESPPIP